MPSKSEAQHRLMEAVAHDPEFAKKAGIPQKVGKEFINADSEDTRTRVFNAHFSRDLPEILKPKDKKSYMNDFLSIRQQLLNK